MVVRCVGFVYHNQSILEVWVYTPKSSAWRCIKHEFALGSGKLWRDDCEFADGVCYWLFEAKAGNEIHFRLLSFDMEAETFYWTYLPEYSKSSSCWMMRKEKSLAIVYGTIRRFDIWLKNGDRSDGSWNKQYSIIPSTHEWHPLVLQDNFFVMVDTKGRRLIIHDLRSGEEKSEYISYSGYEYIHDFSESLISIKPSMNFDSAEALDVDYTEILNGLYDPFFGITGEEETEYISHSGYEHINDFSECLISNHTLYEFRLC
ncbi:hypothetical protein Droror1_Dr00010044 [Drosera rotundifolia]